MKKIRCKWCLSDPLYIQYHDNEWGEPVHNEHKLFEMLTLEGAQAGLSWITILKRRESYRIAFDQFDINKVAAYTKPKINKLLKDPGIIRNRLKVESTVSNAKEILKIQKDYGSFDEFIWSFVDGAPIINNRKTINSIPATTEISDLMSKELKKKGIRFVGSTICYAFMQAIGMVNDHTTDCFKYKYLKKLKQ